MTAYIESGSGVRLGSKTGLTAVIVGFYFVLSIFFAPILSSIPPWASGGALILVGASMASGLTEVKWHLQSHALSATATILAMVLTFSIAYGILFGIGSYVLVEGFSYLLYKVFGVPTPAMTAEELEVSDEVHLAKKDKGSANDENYTPEQLGFDEVGQPTAKGSDEEMVA